MSREIDYYTYEDGTVYSTESNIRLQETAEPAKGIILAGGVTLRKSKQAVEQKD